MAGNKKPRKKYHPGKAAAHKSLLMQLPIADETALRMQRDMERRVLSMRLSQKNPADMVSIVVCPSGKLIAAPTWTSVPASSSLHSSVCTELIATIAK